MSEIVYIIMAGVDYEGSDPVLAFTSKEDADAFIQKCRDYTACKPESPPIESTPENDAAWDRFGKAEERWKKKHPAGIAGANSDNFYMEEVKLERPKK